MVWEDGTVASVDLSELSADTETSLKVGDLSVQIVQIYEGLGWRLHCHQ